MTVKSVKRKLKSTTRSRRMSRKYVRPMSRKPEIELYFDVNNGPAFAHVSMVLKNGQRITANGGSMIWMDSSFKVELNVKGGIFSSLFRAMATSSTFFQTDYVATKDNSRIAFAPYLAGDILPVSVNRGDKFTLASFGFLCATSNVKLTTVTKLKGTLTGESAFLTEISLEPTATSSGMVWLASHGGYEKIMLGEGESMKVDNGMFLMAPSNINWELSTVGGIGRSILSKEGLVMKFTGPCELYVQNRSIHGYIEHVLKKLVKKLK